MSSYRLLYASAMAMIALIQMLLLLPSQVIAESLSFKPSAPPSAWER